MNAHVAQDDITRIHADAIDLPPSVSWKEKFSNWVASQKAKVATWWNTSSRKDKGIVFSMIGLGVIAISLFIYIGSALLTAPAQQVAGKQPATQKVAPPISGAVTPLFGDTATKTQLGIDLLRQAFQQTRVQLDDQAGMLNSHTREINALKEDMTTVKGQIKTDPKVSSGLDENIEAIRKMMAVPPVKLVPLTPRADGAKPMS